jgi:acyl dehydratase
MTTSRHRRYPSPGRTTSKDHGSSPAEARRTADVAHCAWPTSARATSSQVSPKLRLPLGLVHIANRIEQLRPVRADERLDLRVWAAGLAPHERGTQFELHGEAAVAGAVVWRDVSTYLHRESGGGGPRNGAEPPAASAIWTVPGDIGRRYARVSGDANPIHLHPLTAKALGEPGAIAHGMWTKARCLAALEAQLPAAVAVDVRFKLPLRLPGRAAFSYRDGEFEVHDAHTGKPHLSGNLSALDQRASA